MSLEVRFRKKLAASTLDIRFETEGGIIALLGASGSGKTMALRCIAGIEKPDEGRIVLDGEVLYDSLQGIDLPPEKRHVGFLLKDYSLFPGMTIEENIRLAAAAGLRAESRKGEKKSSKPNEDTKKPGDGAVMTLSLKTAAVLHDYGLDGLGGNYPEELSCEEQLRAAFARMMAAGPRLLLLDDPFSSLDGFLKAGVARDMKKKIKEAGLQAVFVSDDRDEVYAMGEKVCVLQKGKTDPAKSVAAFFEDPATVAGAMLSGCENVSKVRLVDPRHALSDEWACIFCFRDTETEGSPFKVFSPETCAVGFRAQDLTRHDPEKEKDKDSFYFPVFSPRIEEDLAFWNVFFRPGAACRGEMQWKVPKALLSEEEVLSVRLLSIPSGKIFSLREKKD